MTAQAAGLGTSRWAHWYQRALPAYWIFLFCLTHFPRLEVDLGVRPSDKAAHVVAFALLAFLFWRFAEATYRQLSGRFVWYAAAWLGAYASLDEWLQQFVGRETDLIDWLCNLTGIAIVLAALEYRRRRRAARDARTIPDSRPPGSGPSAALR